MKDSAFFEVIWFSWSSKSAFHGFQEMLGGGENHSIIMQVTFCQIRHLESFTVTALWGTDFAFYEQLETQWCLHQFPTNSITKQSNVF